MNHGLYSNAMVFSYILLEFLEGEEQSWYCSWGHTRELPERVLSSSMACITHLPHRCDFFSHCPNGGTPTHIEQLLLTGVGYIQWHLKPTIFMLRIFIHPKLQSSSFTLSFRHLYSLNLSTRRSHSTSNTTRPKFNLSLSIKWLISPPIIFYVGINMTPN